MTGSPLNSKLTLGLLLFVGILPFQFNGLYNAKLSYYPLFYWLVEFITWILFPALIYITCIKKGIFKASDIGFHTKIRGYSNKLLFIAVLIIVSIMEYPLYRLFFEHGQILFPPDPFYISEFTYGDVVPDSGPLFYIAIVYLALSAGIVEELYYRGLFRLLFNEGVVNSILYVVISSVVFSSVHWEGGADNLYSTFMLGLLSSTIYVVTKNIWPIISGHIVIDYLWFSQ